MKTRLENAEKVKEKGPKLAGHEFELGDRVVFQNPLTKRTPMGSSLKSTLTGGSA